MLDAKQNVQNGQYIDNNYGNYLVRLSVDSNIECS